MAIGATFWSFSTLNQYVAAVPYTTNPVATGPYLWASQGSASQFARPTGSPGCRVGATVAQFLMLGDLFQQTQQIFFTGDGTTTTFTGTIPTPIADGGLIVDQQQTINGQMSNGSITGTGIAAGSTINYATGALTVNFTTAPATGDQVYAQYTQAAPYRIWWSGIGDPTNWPAPLTNAALAVQSSYDDLDPSMGPVMFIAGYPLYGLIFQRFGITRISYIGGNTVFSFQPYEFKRGVIAHGAAIKVGPLVYFLADDGLWFTDGANVVPVGTAPDNSTGIDRWFSQNVNYAALEAIRSGYDSTNRVLWFAVPSGQNTQPDTLLSYNMLANRWTRSLIPVQTIWTQDNGSDGSPGTQQILGIIDQSNTICTLTGPPMSGYLETVDMIEASGNFRLTTGAYPLVESLDLPTVTVGNRDNLWSPVVYSDTQPPDPFSQMAPVIGEGKYTRIRITSAAATNVQGAIIMSEARRG